MEKQNVEGCPVNEASSDGEVTRFQTTRTCIVSPSFTSSKSNPSYATCLSLSQSLNAFCTWTLIAFLSSSANDLGVSFDVNSAPTKRAPHRQTQSVARTAVC